MGEGGEIKPLTLVTVCGLLATLTAMLLLLASDYAQFGTPPSYVIIPGFNFDATSFAPAPPVVIYL